MDRVYNVCIVDVSGDDVVRLYLAAELPLKEAKKIRQAAIKLIELCRECGETDYEHEVVLESRSRF